MAVYKVPQDVEADDKLIGPFSFRQFIYLIIAVIGIALGWGLSQLFLPLAVIPIPIVIFFGILALPLRKDQPMEIYLAAVVSFYLKPRKRLWQPDGIQSLVEITAPKIVEIQRSKNLSQSEAQQRLSYLADIVDTGGWSVRGVAAAEPNSAMQNDAFIEAQQTEDILDTNSGVAQSFNTMIDQADTRRHEEMLERMRQTPAQSQPTSPAMQVADPYASLAPTPAVTPDPQVNYDPYPNSIHQTIIQPLNKKDQERTRAISTTSVLPKTAPTTSEKPISPDIINLANNPDLSIETIAHEANRIHQKEESLPEDEVVISLR